MEFASPRNSPSGRSTLARRLPPHSRTAGVDPDQRLTIQRRTGEKMCSRFINGSMSAARLRWREHTRLPFISMHSVVPSGLPPSREAFGPLTDARPDPNSRSKARRATLPSAGGVPFSLARCD